ncbi:sulfatase family protein [Saccharicrinis aurantiacus]|uniref:sulfatase family protein n=1 Tax=Saccharicrinis aurantiacus TaxID=1849719 RepID=UPI002490BBD3|nr:sulfatase [Saccharicrinis aurantiacus]
MNLLRRPIKILALFAMCGTVFSCTQKVEKKKKPNIIYIMSDDHTTQGVGVYGSRLAALNPTPVLDKFANEGMIFENCYVTNAICTPSRAAIISGQYNHTNGVIDLEGHIDDKQYLPEELKKLGYETAIIGKWHLHTEPSAFDYYKVLVGHGGQGEYFDPVFIEKGMEYEFPVTKKTKTIKTKGHSTDVITDITIDWLKNRDDSKPYFLMHHYKAPHDMFEFAPRYADYLENTHMPEPASLYDNENNGSVGTKGYNDELIHVIGSSVSHRNTIRNMGMHMDIDQDIADPEYTKLTYQEYIKRYLRCVKGVDDNLARLFAYLEESGELDNTIIIYTGDQGFMLGEHDYIDKRWMYEESMRMPFIVRYPEGIEAGMRTDAIINNTDFAPTIIEMAGGETPDYMQGKSFKSILETGEEPADWRDATYYRYWMHMAHRHANPAHFGIRTKDYKLIFFYGRYWVDTDDPNASWNKKSWGNDFTRHTPPAWELYDLKNDPNEMNNVYGNPEYKEIQDQLKIKLKALREEVGDTDENYPHIKKVVDANWDK